MPDGLHTRARRVAPRKALKASIAAACALAASFAVSACKEPVPEGRVRVVIQGENFNLEPAVTIPQQAKGLGGRESLDPDGGMIFFFPVPRKREFVMRDCIIPIDLAFTDDTGKVLALHSMPPEPPRAENESDRDYELRLKRYPSKVPVRVAIEVAGGTWARLGLEEGDRITFDIEELKQLMRNADPAP